MWVFFVKVEGFSAGVELGTFIYLFLCKTNNKKKHTFVGGNCFFFVCVFSLRARRAGGLNYQEAHTRCAKRGTTGG